MSRPLLPKVEAKAEDIESLTGYTFLDERLAVEAVQMASTLITVVQNNSFGSVIKNTRLSILGNAVLASLLCDTWFNTRDLHGTARLLRASHSLATDKTRQDALRSTVDPA
jgi:hypothetical protein